MVKQGVASLTTSSANISAIPDVRTSDQRPTAERLHLARKGLVTIGGLAITPSEDVQPVNGIPVQRAAGRPVGVARGLTRTITGGTVDMIEGRFQQANDEPARAAGERPQPVKEMIDDVVTTKEHSSEWLW